MMKWIRKTKLWHRFVVLGVLAAMLFAVPMTLYVLEAKKMIDATRVEQAGLPVVRAAVQSLQNLQKHRGLSAAVLAGNKQNTASRETQAGETDKSLKAMSDALNSAGNDAVLRGDAEKAQSEFKSIAAAVAGGSIDGKESFARHTRLIETQIVMIERIADHYGLTLDPEAHLYHVIIAAFTQAPEATEVLGQARAQGVAVLQSGKVEVQDRVRLSQLADEMQTRAARVVGGIEKAIAVEPQLKGALAAAESAMLAQVKTAGETVRTRVIAAEGDRMEPAEFFRVFTVAIDAQFALVNKMSEQIDVMLAKRASALSATRNTVIAFSVAIVLLAMFIGVMITRSVTGPIAQALSLAEGIAGGNLEQALPSRAGDEAGRMLSALGEMQAKLKQEIEQTRKTAAENLRVKNALDKCTTNVMIADFDGQIVYMNESVTAMLAGNEAELRKSLPQFDARRVVGSSFDVFHKNPSHQRNLLANLRATHSTQIQVGQLTFSLTANPIIDERGERVGTVVEWRDRTAEVAVENDVASIVKAANEGNFTKRLALEGKSGFFKQLAEGINGLMQTSEVGLNEVVRVLAALAKGDLTEKITNDYHGTFGQLKDDCNKTVENLAAIVNQIKDASITIDTASKEISQGNTDLSSRTEEQASSLEETASSMEELTSTVKQNAENARQANQLAVGASDVAVKGGDVVKQVVSTMGGISESSRKIADIIGTIDGIAFQTNILALNAAVEAARAGEQGRGFAVVATEVRNLAQRSANAAKEIKQLIEDSVNRVDTGSKLVNQAGETMDEIVNSVKRVTDIMAEITAASQEQSSGIEQVNQAITQMDEVTQQNAALVEQAAAAAESMQEQAGALVHTVAAFKLAGGAEGAAVAERRGPNRAGNVARLPAKPAAAKAERKAAASTAAPKKAVGADEDWQEF